MILSVMAGFTILSMIIILSVTIWIAHSMTDSGFTILSRIIKSGIERDPVR